MSNLQIYNPKRAELNPIAFVRDTTGQVKIRDISNSYELGKQMSIILTEFYNRSGVKGEITDFAARDIKEMLTTKFSTLSLDEIAYAFKMERYGELGERTEHFQSFDAIYVSKVLDKWIARKREIKSAHNITKKPKAPEFSDREKQQLINNAVRKVFRHFYEHQTIKQGYVFVYDELVDSGFLNLSTEEKKDIHKAAQEVLAMEYTEKKPTSREEAAEFKRVLNNLSQPKEPLVIQKCKEISMERFFRRLRKDQKEMDGFIQKYEIPPNE